MAKIPDGWRCIICKARARGGAITHAAACPEAKSQWRKKPTNAAEREQRRQAEGDARDRYDRLVSKLTPARRRDRYQCPACGDERHGGLKVDPGGDGSVLFWCFGCCQPLQGDKDALRQMRAEILHAVGLDWSDIMPAGEPRGFAEWLEGLPEDAAKTAKTQGEESPMAEEAPWGTPESIAKTARTPLPESGNRRPARLWAMVDAVAEAYQVPRALPLLLILAILAACIGGRRRVRVAPDWTEVLSIYTAVAVPSGERKSPVLAILAAPLLAVEQHFVSKALPVIAEQRALRDLRSAAVEKIKKKGDTSPAGIAALKEAVKEVEETVVPAIPRLLADDSTPEAMAKIMAEQGGRLGVLSAEGGLFSTLAGRYSSGIPNLDLVLKAWSGDFCRVDRISRETITLPEPVLSIGLAIQPDILATLAEGRHFRGAGLLARFLYSLPDSLVGSRSIDPDPLPESVSAAYARAVQRLAYDVHGDDDTVEMKLADAARDVLNRLREDLEPRLHPETGDLANIADWANKLPGQLVRVAALFALFEDQRINLVDEAAMREAVDLAPYLISHALAAFDLMTGRRSPLEPARAVLAWVRKKKLTVFSVRQAWRDLSGQTWAEDTEAVRQALVDLEDLGWVRLAPQPEQRGPGRPSERYEVHPSVKEQDS